MAQNFATSQYTNEVYKGRQVASWTIQSDKMDDKGCVSVRCACGRRSHIKAYQLFNGYSLKCKECNKAFRQSFRSTGHLAPAKGDYPPSNPEKEQAMIEEFLKTQKKGAVDAS